MEFIFGADGSVRCVYSDDAAEVARSLGFVRIARASHVEPNADGSWSADMSPVGGPVLGPFATRSEALKAEQLWLSGHNVPEPYQEVR